MDTDWEEGYDAGKYCVKINVGCKGGSPRQVAANHWGDCGGVRRARGYSDREMAKYDLHPRPCGRQIVAGARLREVQGVDIYLSDYEVVWATHIHAHTAHRTGSRDDGTGCHALGNGGRRRPGAIGTRHELALSVIGSSRPPMKLDDFTGEPLCPHELRKGSRLGYQLPEADGECMIKCLLDELWKVDIKSWAYDG